MSWHVTAGADPNWRTGGVEEYQPPISLRRTSTGGIAPHLGHLGHHGHHRSLVVLLVSVTVYNFPAFIHRPGYSHSALELPILI